MTTETTTDTNELTQALAYYYPWVPAGEAYKAFADACATALIDLHARGATLKLPLEFVK
jgi:hypothetical protein